MSSTTEQQQQLANRSHNQQRQQQCTAELSWTLTEEQLGAGPSFTTCMVTVVTHESRRMEQHTPCMVGPHACMRAPRLFLGGSEFQHSEQGPRCLASRGVAVSSNTAAEGGHDLPTNSTFIHAIHSISNHQPRTAPSLTTLLAPCLVDRVFFASTSDSLASAPQFT
jgi:hypothetical protein